MIYGWLYTEHTQTTEHLCHQCHHGLSFMFKRLFKLLILFASWKRFV